MTNPTKDRVWFDFGIKDAGVIRGVDGDEEYLSGITPTPDDDQWVSMKCGCDGETMFLRTKVDAAHWWEETDSDYWVMSWMGCAIHFFDENGDLTDEAELLAVGSDIEEIGRIVQRRKERSMN